MPSLAFNLDLGVIVQIVTAGLLVYGGKVLHGTSVAVATVQTRLEAHEELDDKREERVERLEQRLDREHAATVARLDS